MVHIVDDDVAVRTGFVRLLRSAGLEVCAYPSVGSFLEHLEKAAPGCILLDITMSDLNGTDVLSRLKEQQNTFPAIVVSARDNKAVHKLVHEIGAKMYLRKPVDDQALIDAINWVTRGHAGH
jgi:FixJ family two-component response regulator